MGQQLAEDDLFESDALLFPSEAIGRREWTNADDGCRDARTTEQHDAEKADALLAEIAATPAQSLAGVIAKLAVVVREANDNSDISEFPLSHIRSALADLQRLIDDPISDRPDGWSFGDHSIGSLFEQPASSFAAWRAFGAWSQGDHEGYRAWTNRFKTLLAASQ
jgi:hypothetical protein